MFDYLESFEKRMEFVGVVDSIVNRKNKNQEIESWFQENQLDNLFFTLLVYIMEQTLSENDDCTIENMAAFMEQILPFYNHKFSYDKVKTLTEYMVKDILQNGGALKNFDTMCYGERMKTVRVRLISDKILEDNRIIYQLTDQGYDFLFRTKEVDRELDFKLEQLKLKELLKRKNYKHAVAQSKNLISMLRQKKKELEEFIYRVRQNIHEIDKSEYEKILSETYTLIDEEYEGMQDIRISVEQDETRINQERESNGYLDDTMIKALDSLFEIKRNIQTVIAEQRNLIGRRFSMNQVYEETIQNSFFASIVKRYDFEKEMLEPLARIKEGTIPFLPELFGPLSMPSLNKKLNLNLIYERQGKLKEVSQEDLDVTEEELKESRLLEEVKLNNEIHFRIIERLFKYAGGKQETFTFGEFYRYLEDKTKRINIYTENKRIFLIMLKLYEIQEIDTIKWRNRNFDEEITEANGEFDLAWCLFHLEQRYPDFFGVNKITFEKAENKLKLELPGEYGEENLKNFIEMDDFFITPVNEKAGEGI